MNSVCSGAISKCCKEKETVYSSNVFSGKVSSLFSFPETWLSMLIVNKEWENSDDSLSRKHLCHCWVKLENTQFLNFPVTILFPPKGTETSGSQKWKLHNYEWGSCGIYKVQSQIQMTHTHKSKHTQVLKSLSLCYCPLWARELRFTLVEKWQNLNSSIVFIYSLAVRTQMGFPYRKVFW